MYVSLIENYLFFCFSFFFNDTATTEIYTLSLHDALPILDDAQLVREALGEGLELVAEDDVAPGLVAVDQGVAQVQDRKSTRLNSSHANISYAVFCLKKKKKNLIKNSFLTKINV